VREGGREKKTQLNRKREGERVEEERGREREREK
jgi:hypothetical protein